MPCSKFEPPTQLVLKCFLWQFMQLLSGHIHHHLNGYLELIWTVFNFQKEYPTSKAVVLQHNLFVRFGWVVMYGFSP